jgi:hypothetical protein
MIIKIFLNILNFLIDNNFLFIYLSNKYVRRTIFIIP